MTANDGLGEISGERGNRAVRLERQLEAIPEEVWSALTEPERLKQWLARTEMDARAGGAVTIDFRSQPEGGVMHGTIRICDPPRTLEYDWTEIGDRKSVLRFELEPSGEGTRLVLTHSQLQDGEVPDFAAGWSAYLEGLDDLMRGVAPSRERNAELRARYEELRPVYEKMVAP